MSTSGDIDVGVQFGSYGSRKRSAEELNIATLSTADNFCSDPSDLVSGKNQRAKTMSVLNQFDSFAANLHASALNQSCFDCKEIVSLKKDISMLVDQNTKLKAEIYDVKLGNSRDQTMLELKNKYKRKIQSLQEILVAQHAQIQDAETKWILREEELKAAAELREQVAGLNNRMEAATKELEERNTELSLQKKENEAHLQTIAQQAVTLLEKTSCISENKAVSWS